MGKLERDAYAPDPVAADAYDELYAHYVRLHDHFGRGGDDVMHRLRRPRASAQRSGGEPAAVARLHGAGDMRVAEEPVPAPGPGESLVRVEAVGLCGSDLHWYEEGGIGDARLAARWSSATSSRGSSRAVPSTAGGSRSIPRCIAGAASAASKGTRTCVPTSSSPATGTATAGCAGT